MLFVWIFLELIKDLVVPVVVCKRFDIEVYLLFYVVFHFLFLRVIFRMLVYNLLHLIDSELVFKLILLNHNLQMLDFTDFLRYLNLPVECFFVIEINVCNLVNLDDVFLEPN